GNLAAEGAEAEGVHEAPLADLADVGDALAGPLLGALVEEDDAGAVDNVGLNAGDVQHLLDLRDSDHVVVGRPSILGDANGPGWSDGRCDARGRGSTGRRSCSRDSTYCTRSCGRQRAACIARRSSSTAAGAATAATAPPPPPPPPPSLPLPVPVRSIRPRTETQNQQKETRKSHIFQNTRQKSHHDSSVLAIKLFERRFSIDRHLDHRKTPPFPSVNSWSVEVSEHMLSMSEHTVSSLCNGSNSRVKNLAVTAPNSFLILLMTRGRSRSTWSDSVSYALDCCIKKGRRHGDHLCCHITAHYVNACRIKSLLSRFAICARIVGVPYVDFIDRSMGAEGMMEGRLVFTYGTLKRGFSNHGLLQDMVRTGDAAFVGAARTAGRLPLVCGPYRVPFLLNLPGAGERVSGELYAISPRALARMDELEGTRKGHYERLPISVVVVGGDGGQEAAEVDAEAYYAHRSYAGELWRRNEETGYKVYSEKEAKGYVKRADRPQDITFLDQIRIFLASPQT
ncbi:unnamed protein product, partial [Musa hybrid cultivar]